MIGDGQIVDCRDVAIAHEPFDWPWARTHSARIDEVWAARRREKPQMFDGRVLLMRDLAIDGDRLAGACFETGFKTFLYGRELEFAGTGVVNLFGMAALRSSDGAYMLGEMNAGTSSAGALYFPAGTPEPADLDADGRLDLASNVVRELEEETGIRSEDVEIAPHWTLVVALPKVACMRVMQARETASALAARCTAFNRTQAHPELKRLVPVFSAGDCAHERVPAFMRRYLHHVLGG